MQDIQLLPAVTRRDGLPPTTRTMSWGQYKVLILSDATMEDIRNNIRSIGRHLSHSGVVAHHLPRCSCIVVVGCRMHVDKISCWAGLRAMALSYAPDWGSKT